MLAKVEIRNVEDPEAVEVAREVGDREADVVPFEPVRLAKHEAGAFVLRAVDRVEAARRGLRLVGRRDEDGVGLGHGSRRGYRSGGGFRMTTT